MSENYEAVHKSRPLLLQEQYPILDEDESQVIQIRQGKFGFTHKDDRKPILATLGLHKCIELIGYDNKTSIGFLMHFDYESSIAGSFDRLNQEIYRNVSVEKMEFDVQAIISVHYNPEILADIYDNLEKPKLNHDVILNYVDPVLFVPDKERTWKPGEGMALDTRNGKYFAYLRDSYKEEQIDRRYNQTIPRKELLRKW